jgi:phosphate transport system substrate-binding protein
MRFLISFFCMVFLLVACQNKDAQNKKTKADDTPGNGNINISVDESFRPVMEECIRVYESNNPNAHIHATYKPEADCLKDLFSDTATRLVITSRGLTDDEEDYFKDSMGYVPGFMRIAFDGIALVIKKNQTDSTFTMKRLTKILTGEDASYSVVMDGNKATGTVRFVLDSVLRGKAMGANVGAAKNSLDVLDLASTNDKTIGLVGVSWIGNPEDTAQDRWRQKLKMALLKCEACKDSAVDYFVIPSQESIQHGMYPLTRGIFFILKENYAGLGTGFSNFLQFEQGQLIFRRAYLIPAQMNFRRRTASM